MSRKIRGSHKGTNRILRESSLPSWVSSLTLACSTSRLQSRGCRCTHGPAFPHHGQRHCCDRFTRARNGAEPWTSQMWPPGPFGKTAHGSGPRSSPQQHFCLLCQKLPARSCFPERKVSVHFRIPLVPWIHSTNVPWTKYTPVYKLFLIFQESLHLPVMREHVSLLSQ